MQKAMAIAVVAIACALSFSALSLTGCDNGLSPGSGPDNGPKTDLTVMWPDGLTAARGQRLSSIPLAAYTNGNTGTFAWTTPSQAVSGELGVHAYSMTFTPTDRTRHNTARSGVDVLVSLVDMVRIEPGDFTMGSPTSEADRNGDEAQWQVALSGFYLGKFEVTQKQYETVMGEPFEALYKRVFSTNWSTIDLGQGDDFPVYGVSWYEALVFCNKLSMLEGLSPAYSINGSTNPDNWGAVPEHTSTTWNNVTVVAESTGYRLPTEAQWEYACRAGTTTPWYFGEMSYRSDEYAWTYLNSTIESYGYITGKTTTGRKASKVGQKLPNPWGLYDMLGNAAEWVWDWKDTYPNVARLDPMGPSGSQYTYHTIRGGNYTGNPQNMRSAFRSQGNPVTRGNYNGFRIARPEGLAEQPDYSINHAAIDYSANGPAVSRFLGYYWEPGGFSWNFKNDGAISTVHCCGAEFPTYGYLICGNILLTYGGSHGYESLIVNYITVADDGKSFIRSNGIDFIKYSRGTPYPYTGSDPDAPLVISNDLLGAWQGEGKQYVFGNDARLQIGSEQYGYVVRNNKLVILGPLVDRGTVALSQYTFILADAELSLIGKDDTVTLSRREGVF